MNVEILLITLLYAVTLVGFIAAINSRGPARIGLSYFFAILCLCASVFHTARLLTSSEGLFGASSEAERGTRAGSAAPAERQTRAVTQEAVIMPADTDVATPPPAQANAQQSGLAEARNRLRSLVESSSRLQGNLSRLVLQNLIDLPEEEFQYMRSVAASSVAEASKLQARFNSLKGEIPTELAEAGKQVERGLEALNGACHNLDRFFRAENEAEERLRRESFLSERQQAAAFFRRALDRL